jgi:hypothetical protein
MSRNGLGTLLLLVLCILATMNMCRLMTGMGVLCLARKARPGKQGDFSYQSGWMDGSTSGLRGDARGGHDSLDGRCSYNSQLVALQSLQTET